MKITLSNSVLDNIDTQAQHVAPFVPNWYQPYYHQPSGQEHYRLLMYISQQYNYEILADVGTNRGASAVALAFNPSNLVYSVDLVDCKEGEPLPKNCEYVIGNMLWESNILDQILKCKFIMLDIDHEYHNEIQIYKRLIDSGWKGIMLCDDIHLNEPMKRFWNEVDAPKLDITKYGHISGTGAIIFDDTEFDLK